MEANRFMLNTRTIHIIQKINIYTVDNRCESLEPGSKEPLTIQDSVG